jgi:hypothetical protein
MSDEVKTILYYRLFLALLAITSSSSLLVLPLQWERFFYYVVSVIIFLTPIFIYADLLDLESEGEDA